MLLHWILPSLSLSTKFQLSTVWYVWEDDDDDDDKNN